MSSTATAEELQAQVEARRRRAASGGSGSGTRTRDEPPGGLLHPLVETVLEEVPCPSGCGGTVPWTYLKRTEKRQGVEVEQKLPASPPLCGACSLPSRDERLREIEEGRVERVQEEERRARAEQQRAASILDVLKACGVNTREHGHVSLRDFDFSECGEAVEQECWRFIADARRAGPHDAVEGLYLWGTMGNGKTQLLAGIARELLMDPDWGPDDVVFDVSADLMEKVQATYREGGEGSTTEVKRRRIEARVYLLDDLGTERPRDDPARILYQIINARALAPTAIASNFTPQEIEERHPELERVGSRLGPAYYRRVRVEGGDRRFRRRGAGPGVEG